MDGIEQVCLATTESARHAARDSFESPPVAHCATGESESSNRIKAAIESIDSAKSPNPRTPFPQLPRGTEALYDVHERTSSERMFLSGNQEYPSYDYPLPTADYLDVFGQHTYQEHQPLYENVDELGACTFADVDRAFDMACAGVHFTPEDFSWTNTANTFTSVASTKGEGELFTHDNPINDAHRVSHMVSPLTFDQDNSSSVVGTVCSPAVPPHSYYLSEHDSVFTTRRAGMPTTVASTSANVALSSSSSYTPGMPLDLLWRTHHELDENAMFVRPTSPADNEVMSIARLSTRHLRGADDSEDDQYRTGGRTPNCRRASTSSSSRPSRGRDDLNLPSCTLPLIALPPPPPIGRPSCRKACNKTFNRDIDRNRHEKGCGNEKEDLYVCPRGCRKAYQRLDALQRHYFRKHEKERSLWPNLTLCRRPH